MGEFIDRAGRILAVAQQRAEVAGQNIANGTTPGYKRAISFSDAVRGGTTEAPIATQSVDFSQGRMIETGNPFDLALETPGFFLLRNGDTTALTRHGQFRRDADGRLLTAGGFSLQQPDGRDLIVSSDNFKVTSDGVVTEDGVLVGRIAVVDAENPAQVVRGAGGFTAPAEALAAVSRPSIRQGMTEASNVVLGDEMVNLMAALRIAETGQRLTQTYDDLLGRVISTFGKA